MSKKKISILLIEDDAVDQLAFQRLVEDKKLPYKYNVAGSAAEARKALSESEFDLVISDFTLGDGTAFDVLDFQKHAPVIILTGAGNEEIAVSAMKKGAYDYMTKDIDRNYLKVLPIIAENTIRRKKADDELINYRQRLVDLVAERTSELNEAYEKLSREILERKQAEAEAIRSSQLASLGELAAGIAHEVNNPVNGIINYAQLLVNSLVPGSRENDIAGRIIKEGDRIANLVTNLLSFARDSKNEKSTCDINHIMLSTLALTEAQLRHDGILLKVDMPSGLPQVRVNLQQIEQVFLNVISNSRYALNRKFHGNHPEKQLGIRAESLNINGQSGVRVSFHDRGTGIPAGIIDKITDPFFSTKPANISTGLGLSISHGIITDHGGSIAFESIEGEFTEVVIDLPADYSK